jgi:hypothetical protein
MKASVQYKNARINGRLTDIRIEDGRFCSFEKTEQDGIDLSGRDVFPGLIDLHCHGAMGYDVLGDTEHIETISTYLAENGITTWFPTTGGSKETILKMLNTPLDGYRGANLLGYHLEGPYLSPHSLGACAPDSIKLPDLEDFAGYDNVKRITMAPELEGAIDYIRGTKATVTIGHTKADYATAMAAIDAGASCLTHTFNQPTLEVYIGRFDISEGQQAELQHLLDGLQFDEYDRLIQLCDCLAGAQGVMDMEARMLDVKQRYGFYRQDKWDTNLWLKAYFEEKTGENIYETVK